MATKLAMVSIDCADAAVSSAFWASLMDWEVVASGEGYAMLAGPGAAVGFGSVPDYQPPAWPNDNGSKQFHLDVATDDIPGTEMRAVELGATVPDEQPGDTWRVLLDPTGHPFCLTDAAAWS